MKTHELCATIVPFNIKRKGFSNLTGSFLNKSSKSNIHFMVMYDYNSNAILAEPIKNGQAATIRYAFLNTHKILKPRGSEPKFYIMDNDCSSDLKEAMKK